MAGQGRLNSLELEVIEIRAELMRAGQVSAEVVTFQTMVKYALTPHHNADMFGVKNVHLHPAPHSSQMIVEKIKLSERRLQFIELW